MGAAFAEKANAATGPVAFLIPLRGVSILDGDGEQFCDREADQAIDTSELEHIAKTTGGRFFRARDRGALERAYAEIEALERTPREDRKFIEHYDLYPALLAWGLGLYLAAWLCACTLARRLP